MNEKEEENDNKCNNNVEIMKLINNIKDGDYSVDELPAPFTGRIKTSIVRMAVYPKLGKFIFQRSNSFKKFTMKQNLKTLRSLCVDYNLPYIGDSKQVLIDK